MQSKHSSGRLHLELLSAEHDRAGFDCGVEELNVYLRQVARQHTEKGASKTYVMVERAQNGGTGTPALKPIVGFFTLALCKVNVSALPPALAKKLLKESYALLLGKLAVSISRQRQGLGHCLLSAALLKVEKAATIAGGVGLWMDAKDAAAAAYYAQFGFQAASDNPLKLFLPMATIQAHNAAC